MTEVPKFDSLEGYRNAIGECLSAARRSAEEGAGKFVETNIDYVRQLVQKAESMGYPIGTFEPQIQEVLDLYEKKFERDLRDMEKLEKDFTKMERRPFRKR